MKVESKMVSVMVMASSIITKEASIVEIGSRVKCMVMELSITQMEELLIRVNGALTLWKEKEFSIIKMSKNLKKDLIIEILNWVNKYGFHTMVVL